MLPDGFPGTGRSETLIACAAPATAIDPILPVMTVRYRAALVSALECGVGDERRAARC
jgi:hypothetical protein